MDKPSNNRIYKGFKLEDVVHRKGGLDMLKYPSLIFKHRHYPDGTKKPVASESDNL